jgi:enoyl-CoA hydratase/carnithine racemase
MSPQFAWLQYEVRHAVATITINRPERHNALSWSVVRELREAVAIAKADADVRVLVFTGAGDRAFSAGADLSGLGDITSFTELHETRGEVGGLFADVWAAGKPTIARVQGYALGAGLGMALMCDIVIATEDARFGTPEIDVGLWPMMVTVPMLRSMAPKIALEMMMTARRVGAAEAQRLGFVNRVVTADELDAVVAETAATLAAKSPAVMKLGRDAFYRAVDLDAAHAQALLHAALGLITQTEDSAEGIAAYLAHRSPRWSGR